MRWCRCTGATDGAASPQSTRQSKAPHGPAKPQPTPRPPLCNTDGTALQQKQPKLPALPPAYWSNIFSPTPSIDQSSSLNCRKEWPATLRLGSNQTGNRVERKKFSVHTGRVVAQ